MNLYEFDSYKKYVAKKIDYLSENERGLRTQIAEHIQCQLSYLSQVLNGKPDFTLEQACRLNNFFHHDKDESRYFILLVEMARSGSSDLREHFQEQLRELKTQSFELKKRLKVKDEIPLAAQHTYYSTWFYSAVHIALAIPELQRPAQIAQRLNLPEEMVVKAIKFLVDIGLVELKGKSYEFTKRHVHLGSESEFIQRHHINWRSQALQSVEKNLATDLHYSNVVSLSKEDFEKIKEMVIENLKAVREVTKPSKAEDLCAITFDIFRL
jgi:uncharacterized protein (TIGR02147 family)